MADRHAAAERLREFIEGSFTGAALRSALADVETLEQLPELYGTAAAATVLGTTPANMQRWRTLPDPLYDLPAGKFYDADAIRELAARRAEGAAA